MTCTHQVSSGLQWSCCKNTIRDTNIISSSKSLHVVLQRLLDWMDRCDVAMQHGWAKPAFQTTMGEEIFPDSDEAWWLTKMSKRGPTEAAHLEDEDGPWKRRGKNSPMTTRSPPKRRIRTQAAREIPTEWPSVAQH